MWANQQVNDWILYVKNVYDLKLTSSTQKNFIFIYTHGCSCYQHLIGKFLLNSDASKIFNAPPQANAMLGSTIG